jgi:CHAD domain-containing protein
MQGRDRLDLPRSPLRSRVVPGLVLDGAREDVTRHLLARTWDVAVIDARGWLEREDADVELLHQFRVALRRCRVYERELGGMLPRDLRDALRGPMRSLFRASGPLRDLHALRTTDDPVLVAIREAAEPRAVVAAEASARAAFEAAYRAEWAVELGETLRLLPFETVSGDQRTFREHLERRISRRLERTRDAASELREESPAAAFHRLRRSAKTLRYLNDVRLASGDQRGSRVRKETARLQAALGAFQDFVVAEALAPSLGLEVEGAHEARRERRLRALDAARRFARKA